MKGICMEINLYDVNGKVRWLILMKMERFIYGVVNQ